MKENIVLFNEKYLHAVWNPVLIGKEVVVSDVAINIMVDINDNKDYHTYRRVITGESDIACYPFSDEMDNHWSFAYYDPTYKYKVAFKNGMKVEYRLNATSKDAPWIEIRSFGIFNWIADRYDKENFELRINESDDDSCVYWTSEKQMALEQWRHIKKVVSGEVSVADERGTLQRIKSDFIKSNKVNGREVDWKHECILCEHNEKCCNCPLQKCDYEGTAYHLIHNYLLFEGEEVNKETAMAACDIIITAIESTVPDDFSSDYTKEILEAE